MKRLHHRKCENWINDTIWAILAELPVEKIPIEAAGAKVFDWYNVTVLPDDVVQAVIALQVHNEFGGRSRFGAPFADRATVLLGVQTLSAVQPLKYILALSEECQFRWSNLVFSKIYSRNLQNG